MTQLLIGCSVTPAKKTLRAVIPTDDVSLAWSGLQIVVTNAWRDLLETAEWAWAKIRRRTVTRPGSGQGEMGLTIVAAAAWSMPPPKYDPSKERSALFDELAEYARKVGEDCHTAIDAERRERERATTELRKLARDLALAGYRTVVIGVILLLLGLALALAANSI